MAAVSGRPEARDDRRLRLGAAGSVLRGVPKRRDRASAIVERGAVRPAGLQTVNIASPRPDHRPPHRGHGQHQLGRSRLSAGFTVVLNVSMVAASGCLAHRRQIPADRSRPTGQGGDRREYRRHRDGRHRAHQQGRGGAGQSHHPHHRDPQSRSPTRSPTPASPWSSRAPM